MAEQSKQKQANETQKAQGTILHVGDNFRIQPILERYKQIILKFKSII